MYILRMGLANDNQERAVHHLPLHAVVDPDIRGENSICFPVSHVYFFVGGGPKSIAKLHGGMAAFSPLDPPLINYIKRQRKQLKQSARVTCRSCVD